MPNISTDDTFTMKSGSHYTSSETEFLQIMKSSHRFLQNKEPYKPKHSYYSPDLTQTIQEKEKKKHAATPTGNRDNKPYITRKQRLQDVGVI